MSSIFGFFNKSKDKKSEQTKEPAKPAEPVRTREDLETSLSVRYQALGTVQTQDGCREKIFLERRRANAYERRQLKEVLDVIESVPAGKKILSNAIKNGYKFSFETFDSNCDGCLYAPAKTIMLNPANHASVASMAATTFHELIHALQNEQTDNLLANGARLNIADQIKFHRASEAAAWAEEAKFIYQIKDKYPEVLKHTGHVPMYQAFAKEMETSGDMGKAGEASFKSWYGFRCYQGAYEQEHIANISNHLSLSLAQRDDKILQQSMSAEEVLDKVLVSEEIRRNINPEFLTQKEAFSISREGAEKLQTFVRNYREYLPETKEDRSVGKMFELKRETVIRKEPEKQKSEQEKPKTETTIRFSPDDMPFDKASAVRTEHPIHRPAPQKPSLMASLSKMSVSETAIRTQMMRNRIAER